LHADAVPPCCRRHVYVFFLEDLTPLEHHRLQEVRDYVHSCGFLKTYLGHALHTGSMRAEISRLHADDPDAQIVLVGCHRTNEEALRLADALGGGRVDLLVCFGVKTSCPLPPRPANVCKALYFVAGQPEDDGAPHAAEYHFLPDAGAFGCAAHPCARETLVRELVALAAKVPFVAPPSPEMPDQLEEAPKPRPVQPPPPSRDDWDFLQPRDPTKEPERRPAVEAPGGAGEPLPGAEGIGLPRKMEKNR